MSLVGLLLCLAAVVAVIVLPLVVLACRLAWELPPVGAMLAGPVLVGAYYLIPRGCLLGPPCGLRLAWILFGFVLWIGATLTVTTLAGAVRLARIRLRARAAEPPAPVGLPPARALPPR